MLLYGIVIFTEIYLCIYSKEVFGGWEWTPWPQKFPGKQAFAKSALVHKADLWNCHDDWVSFPLL